MANYGTLGEYRDNPGQRESRDDLASVTQITEQIRSNVFKINNGANGVERALKGIGTDRDSTQLRDKIHETSQSTNQIIQTTTRLIRNASSKRADKTQKIQLDLLKSNFQDSVQRFQNVQKKAADKVKASVKLGAPKSQQPLVDVMDETHDRAGLVEEEQRRVQMLQEQEGVIEDDLALVREREERILQLETDILDVNEIFRDLGTLVHAQGEVLDTIDSNVEVAAGRVEEGNEQLTKALHYQRKSRKKMCCLLGIVLVVLAIIAIIIVVSVKG